ncbi:hypothetical protein LCGC14_3067540, partial [marine sediment metagenome]
MAYSKVPRGLWESPKFRALPEDSRTLYFFLLTSQHANSFGYYLIDDAYICADIQWKPDRLADAWEPLIDADYVRRDTVARMVLIVAALEENKPDNRNVSIRWRSMLNALPSSNLRHDLEVLARAFLSTGVPWQLSWIGLSEEHPEALQPELTEARTEGLSQELPNSHSPEPIAQSPNPITHSPDALSSLRSERGHAHTEKDHQEWVLRLQEATNGAGSNAVLADFARGHYAGCGLDPPNTRTLRSAVGQMLKGQAGPENVLAAMLQADESPRADFLKYTLGI